MTRLYDVWGRSATELRPSLYAEDLTRKEAIAEAEGMWHGSESMRSVWVQSRDLIVWAKGEKADELKERGIRPGGGFRG